MNKNKNKSKSKSGSVQNTETTGGYVRRLVMLGFYWWRGSSQEPWQVVEIYEQSGEIFVGRVSRWKNTKLCERGGEWGSKISAPRFGSWLQSIAVNLIGGFLACIERLPIVGVARIQTTHQDPAKNEYPVHPARLAVSDWIGVPILPYGHNAPCNGIGMIRNVQEDSFQHNAEGHITPKESNDHEQK